MNSFFNSVQIVAIGIFLSLMLGRSVYMSRIRGINPFQLSLNKPLGEALLEGCLVVVLPLFVYEIVAFAWPLPWHVAPEILNGVVFHSTPIRFGGGILIASAIAIFASALLSFGDSWRVGIDQTAPGELVTSGVFALTRNPIFLALDAYAIGSFLISGRPVFALFALFAVVVIHLQIRREEAFLEECYGDAYREYRTRTSRYVI